jgi:predicted DNA-binding transcriptional regulator AlpA
MSDVSTIPPEVAAADEKRRRKAALAPDNPKQIRDREHTHGARAPPKLAERLLNKYEVMAISGVSYPTLWDWMRKGRFPRSLVVGGRSMWRSTEVDAWLAGLPLRPLKGDLPPEAA